MAKEKISFKEQLKLGSEASCLAAIKGGWVAGLISIGLTLVIMLIGMNTNTNDKTILYFSDPTVFIDLAFVVVMVFFIYKKSRIAATSMFIYFVAAKYIQWIDLGAIQGLPLAVVFVFFYFNAMRGTYVWHSKYKRTSNDIIE